MSEMKRALESGATIDGGGLSGRGASGHIAAMAAEALALFAATEGKVVTSIALRDDDDEAAAMVFVVLGREASAEASAAMIGVVEARRARAEASTVEEAGRVEAREEAESN